MLYRVFGPYPIPRDGTLVSKAPADKREFWAAIVSRFASWVMCGRGLTPSLCGMLAAAGIGVSALGAQAVETTRWVRVDRRPEIVVSVDRYRIDTIGPGMFQVWMKWDLPGPTLLPNGIRADRWLSHTIVDCTRIQSMDTELVYYLGDQTQRALPIPEDMREWVAAPPQSVGESTTVRGCLIAMGKPTDPVR